MTTRRKIIAGVITLIVIVIATAISCGGSQNAPALTGRWTGSYICSQGDTGLRLVLRVQGKALTGTFSFYPLARNPGVSSGEYTLTGTYSATRTDLVPGRWISEPSGYQLVGLTAGPPADNGAVLRGRVSNPACSTFSVTK